MFWRNPGRRLLSMTDERRVLEAIRAAEARTSGELRVHVVRTSRGEARADAERWFVRLGMHATRERNGVLFFLATADRRFAVIGDRGIHERVGEAFWDRVRELLEGHFRKREFAEGLVRAVEQVGDELSRAFPRDFDDRNELPDAISFEDRSES